MSIDRADWHYGGDYPDDLPDVNGGTHIGMFIAWLILNRHESEDLRDSAQSGIDAVRARTMTGRTFLFEFCDEKFTDDMLSDGIAEFVADYYREDYVADYEEMFEDADSLYHVEDTWANYERIAPLIDTAFAAHRPAPGS
jgi:hypothetical protein